MGSKHIAEDSEGPHFCRYIHHADSARESAFGRFEEAKAKGWIVVSMKEDWATIFPPAK